MSADWRADLNKWLKNNSKTMSPELVELRQEFLERFPQDQLSEMTLEDYALGTQKSQDSFCYWLEYRTKEMGGIGGGSASKHGVWWSKTDNAWRFNKVFSSAQDALDRIKQGLLTLFQLVEQGRFQDLDKEGRRLLGPNRYSLRGKPLYMYYPEHFLPIANPSHLRHFLQVFGEHPRGDLHALNRQLLDWLRAQPEFEGFDTHQLQKFLYDCFSPKQDKQSNLQKLLANFAAYAKTEDYQRKERDYKSRLIQNLGEVVSDESRTVPGFLEKLAEVFKQETARIDNLTNWTQRDDFRKYLAQVAEERIRALLNDLFDEEEELAFRIDRFKDNLDQDFAQFLGDKKRINLGMISLLLTAYDPQTYTIYRYSTIENIAKEMGEEMPKGEAGTNGANYQAFLDYIKPIQEKLSETLDREADLIDVHSFLWLSLHPELMQGVVEETPHLSIPETLLPLWELAQQTKNIILYGPPGTGKTWLSHHFAMYFVLSQTSGREAASQYWDAVNSGLAGRREDITQLQEIASEQHFQLVTFHQSFAYEEFVEGLRPVLDSENSAQLAYEVRPGIFRNICEAAQKDWETMGESAPNYCLLIDEINRANIARVFGELITLIEDDKRSGQSAALEVRLPYSGKKFSVPPNLYIIGTMNSADRSIALLDTALRRRFTFYEVMPDSSLLESIGGIDLSMLLEELNQRITALLDRDHQIGHSYFLAAKNLEDLHYIWYHKIIPLLQEYFYNDYTRLAAVIGTDFVERQQISNASQKALGDYYDPEIMGYVIKNLDPDAFVEAINQILE